MFVLKNKNRY